MPLLSPCVCRTRCLEQNPMFQYSFILATGRKYLLAFFDRYDTYVTSNFAISVFKMAATEHILFTTSHKAPFAREAQQRAWVTRGSEPAWAITAQEKDWAAFPASTLRAITIPSASCIKYAFTIIGTEHRLRSIYQNIRF